LFTLREPAVDASRQRHHQELELCVGAKPTLELRRINIADTSAIAIAIRSSTTANQR
jgi:hypothetical protein